jgi:threonine dehydrogenase-like Zn-dependent dehydrogenase
MSILVASTDSTATTKPEYKHREGGETMRALAWFGNKDVRMVDAPIPDISEPKDVIVKISGTTICGSDLHLYHSEMLGLQSGDILGHEFMYALSSVHSGSETDR